MSTYLHTCVSAIYSSMSAGLLITGYCEFAGRGSRPPEGTEDYGHVSGDPAGKDLL